jgi:hypothetical protein
VRSAPRSCSDPATPRLVWCRNPIREL